MEILLAMGIGLGLVAAFLVVLQRCRNDFAANESLARLQDAARHASNIIAADIEHAGFYGFRPGDSVELASALPPGIENCGADFAVDLAREVSGTDAGYLSAADAADCEPAATAGGASGTADTLTLRHASLDRVAPRAGRLQVYSTALGASPLRLFADGHAPGPVDDSHEIRDVEVRTYYIANSSVDRPGWPALRVKALTESRGAAQFRDEEVMPGIEDLQVVLRVMRSEGGAREFRQVPASSTLAPEDRVVAVNLWLRVRADVTESGYRDSRPMEYAGTSFIPDGAQSRQRRLLIQRTVALRNARP